MQTVTKRTFEAKNHLVGSAERDALNRNSLTSEYMPSYKYVTLPEGYTWTTRRAAETRAASSK
jgi:hypothetical protein